MYILDDGPRSNNHTEGWQSKIRKKRIKGQTFLKLLIKLFQRQSATEVTLLSSSVLEVYVIIHRGKNFIKITSVGMGAAKSNETR